MRNRGGEAEGRRVADVVIADDVEAAVEFVDIAVVVAAPASLVPAPGEVEGVVDADIEAGEDEPPEASAEILAAGSAGGETGVSNGDDLGDGGREAVAAGKAEDDSQVDGEEAGSEETARAGDDTAGSGGENETGAGGEAAAGPKEGQPDRQVIAEELFPPVERAEADAVPDRDLECRGLGVRLAAAARLDRDLFAPGGPDRALAHVSALRNDLLSPCTTGSGPGTEKFRKQFDDPVRVHRSGVLGTGVIRNSLRRPMDRGIRHPVAIQRETEHGNLPGFAAGTQGGGRPASTEI